MNTKTAQIIPDKPRNWSYDPRADQSCRKLEAIRLRAAKEVATVFGATLAAKHQLGSNAPVSALASKAKSLLKSSSTRSTSSSGPIDPTLWALLD
jgi:hypothetical protein